MVFQTKKTVHRVMQVPNASGELGDYDCYIVPEFDAGGQVVTVIGICRDITEEKRLEAELLRLDRMNTVGEMAAALSHEIRNPITTVRGYLQRFMLKEENSRYHEQLIIMIEELDRANSIISEFLSLAKNKAVKHNRKNINKVVNLMFLLLQSEAFRTGHDIEADLSDVPDINMDENEIRQLLLNLARNSFEAMEDGGMLSIRTYIEKGEPVLAVQDTGKGIPQEILDNIGTPFLTTKAKGTGLGLSVCYRIAARHGAKIDVKSSPAGTTFVIRFQSI